MRSTRFAIAAVVAATTLAAGAQPRSEADSPFTYEVLGATPSLTFGRKAASPAPQARKPAAGAAADARGHAAAPRAAAGGAFTYDALGATPRVELKRPPAEELVTRQPSR